MMLRTRPFVCGTGNLGDTFVVTDSDKKPKASGTVEKFFYREDWTVLGIVSESGEFWQVPHGSAVEFSLLVITGETIAKTGSFNVVSLAGSGDLLRIGPAALFM